MEEQDWLLKTGDPLIQVHLHCIMDQAEKKTRLLNTGGSLIEVVT